jgi:hypothetical protein
MYVNNTTGAVSSAIRGGFYSSTFAATSTSGLDSAYGFLNYLYYTGSADVVNYAGYNQILYKSTQGGTTTFTGTQTVLKADAWMHATNNQNYVFSNGIEGVHISLRGGGTGTFNGTQATGLYIQDIDMDLTNNVAIWLEPQTNADTNNYGIVLDGNGAGSDIVFGPNQDVKMYRDAGGQLYVSGATVCDQSCISDMKYKNNIRPIESSLDKVMKIQGVSYSWNRDEYEDMNFPEGTRYGVVAQEIEKVLPEVVREDSKGNKSVAYKQLIPVLVEAMKEQQDRISDLTKEVKELKSEVAKKNSLSVNYTEF